MPYFRVWSAAGASIIAIDDTYKNQALSSRGTASTSEGYGNLAARVATVTVTGADPSIAVLSSVPSGLLTRTQSGSQWTFKILFAGDATFNYYVFDNPSATVAGKYLVLRRGDGQVVFNAAQAPLRVVGVINSNVGASVGLPAGRTCAILLGINGRRVFQVSAYQGPPPAPVRTDSGSSATLTSISGSTANVSTVALGSYSSLDPVPATPRANWSYGTLATNNLIVDVTNL